MRFSPSCVHTKRDDAFDVNVNNTRSYKNHHSSCGIYDILEIRLRIGNILVYIYIYMNKMVVAIPVVLKNTHTHTLRYYLINAWVVYDHIYETLATRNIYQSRNKSVTFRVQQNHLICHHLPFLFVLSLVLESIMIHKIHPKLFINFDNNTIIQR